MPSPAAWRARRSREESNPSPVDRCVVPFLKRRRRGQAHDLARRQGLSSKVRGGFHRRCQRPGARAGGLHARLRRPPGRRGRTLSVPRGRGRPGGAPADARRIRVSLRVPRPDPRRRDGDLLGHGSLEAFRPRRVEVSQCRKVRVKYLETESLRVLPSEEVEKSWRNRRRPGSGTAT